MLRSKRFALSCNDLCSPKVDEFDDTIVVQQNVCDCQESISTGNVDLVLTFGFDVSMNDTTFVEVSETFQHL